MEDSVLQIFVLLHVKFLPLGYKDKIILYFCIPGPVIIISIFLLVISYYFVISRRF